MQRGILSGVAAYLLWGLLPLYWKWLENVPPLEILSHRVIWSLLFCLLALAILGRSQQVFESLRNRQVVQKFMMSAILLSFNWGLFIWAVNSGHIVETSLGYFINPLVSVALGVLFFDERLRPIQWISIGAAAIGVLYLSIANGQPPWISLALAVSFAVYGLLKKQASLPALQGLTLETILIIAPALLYVTWLVANGRGSLTLHSPSSAMLLVGAGVATAIPLLFFATAAQRIPLSLLGVLQYIAPSIQLFIGVALFGEPFDSTRLMGFLCIWTGLLLFAGDGLSQYRRSAANRTRAAQK